MTQDDSVNSDAGGDGATRELVLDRVLDAPRAALWRCWTEPGVFLEVVDGRRLVFTDALRPGWQPARRAFMVAEIRFEDEGAGKTRYRARAMHWSAEAMKEHEEMGFHEGWNKATDQLVELAQSLEAA